MPCCCCGVLGDPFPNMSYDEIPEDVVTKIAAEDVYGMFFGGIGVACVVVFFPAVILLQVGQKQRKNLGVGIDCRSFGFGLMILWVGIICIISAVSWNSFPHDFEPTIEVDWIFLHSKLLKNTMYVLAAEIVLALCCASILVRAPKVLDTDTIVSG